MKSIFSKLRGRKVSSGISNERLQVMASSIRCGGININTPKDYVSPYIIKESENIRTVQVDVFSELLKNRTLFFDADVNRDSVVTAMCQLLYMVAVSKEPITMYIATPGGDVYYGLALYDLMEMIKAEGVVINVYCIGLAASMGSILMCGGTRGHRYALKHSRIMIHQPLSGTGAGHHQETDIRILSEETSVLRKELQMILAEASGKSYEEVNADCERDNWLMASQCLPGVYGEFGLIDEIKTKF